MNVKSTWLVMGLVAGAALNAWALPADENETKPVQISPTGDRLGETTPVQISPARDRLGRVVVPERPTAIDAPTVLRPTLDDRPDLTPEVKARIEAFRRDARAYLEKQQALTRELLGANDEQRASIREKLEEVRQQWLERSRQMAEEFRDRREDLIRKMPERQEIIDNTREAVREQMRDARGEIRKRRGDE
jgi:hypothetical protein